MLTLFQYNWQVRNDWFDWSETISEEELLRERVGGVGGILKTLLHIVDVEYSWLQLLQGRTVKDYEIDEYGTFGKGQRAFGKSPSRGGGVRIILD